MSRTWLVRLQDAVGVASDAGKDGAFVIDPCQWLRPPPLPYIIVSLTKPSDTKPNWDNAAGRPESPKQTTVNIQHFMTCIHTLNFEH